MQSAISTPAAPAGGDASACTTALLTPKPQPAITKEQATCLLHALLRGRMQTLRLFDTGLISFESRREHLEVIRQAESIVHALARDDLASEP